MAWMAGLGARSPPQPRRCRTVIPLLAGIGRGGPGRSGDPGTGQKKGTPKAARSVASHPGPPEPILAAVHPRTAVTTRSQIRRAVSGVLTTLAERYLTWP
jgi:hypothetical protein